MLVGRFFVTIPTMAIAGSLAAKKIVPASSGTVPTTGILFVGLLVGVILILGGLTFFPALASAKPWIELIEVRYIGCREATFSTPTSSFSKAILQTNMTSACGRPVERSGAKQIYSPVSKSLT